MAKSRYPQERVIPPSVDHSTGQKLLTALLEKGQLLKAGERLEQAQFETWKNLCVDSITKTFGSDSDYLSQFYRAGQRMQVIMGHQSEAYYERLNREELDGKLGTVKSLIDAIDFMIGMQSTSLTNPDSQKIPAAPRPKTREVFIVHGHDEAIKVKVARFLERLELKSVILHEQPDAGLTIIEKLEKHAAGASFAVVILTPDDSGYAKGQESQLKARARQNVILELGYFVGKLGRSHVCPLYTSGVELPSDLLGVAYTPLDENSAWELKLARELRAAGLEIDMNRL